MFFNSKIKISFLWQLTSQGFNGKWRLEIIEDCKQVLTFRAAGLDYIFDSGCT